MNAKHALLIVTLAATVFAGAAGAQTAPNDTLFQQLGARPGLVALTDAFMVRLLADPRMSPFFKDIDQKVFKSQLVDQLCEVSGGPCKFKGKDMKTVHEGQDITRSNFNALVEVLQQSMDAQGIPFGAQNRLLAQLAPMHREIINAP
jgi:hemoglobin